ncbi:nuclear transport factor 2 family protein [Sciscionella marina]|uniref:nuclear transport factor 2 family protein n=1 Tax=Sciscionella marina TaxID=508770 RepID=UPI00037B2BCB|nr:nuclear transport factor 2 family protein [Sciscionella marina]
MSAQFFELLELLGGQAHAIDSGRALDWARTFTEDGVFASPSYPEPVRGRAALTRFAERFAANNPGAHHIVTNACIADSIGPDECRAMANLLIVRTLQDGAVRIERVTTIHDHLLREHGALRVAERVVTRD